MALSVRQVQQFTATAATSIAGALTMQPTAGNLLVAVVTANNASNTGSLNPTCTDSAGNTWTRFKQSFDATPTTDTSVHYAKNITTGASFTVTGNTGGSTNCALTMTVYEIVGADLTAPADVNAGATGTSATPTCGPATNTLANSIYIGAINDDDRGNPGTLTGPAGWTLDTSQLNGATYGVCGCASLIVSTSAARSAVWGTANAVFTSVVAVFKAAATPTMAASPTSINTSTSGNVITLTGTNTAWVAGTTTFSISGVAGCSITSQSCTSATAGTITVSTGSTAGTLTVADSLDSATATVSVVATPLVVHVNDVNWFFSRANWYKNGSTYAESNTPAAYTKVAFTVPAGGAGQCTLTVDTTPMGAAAIPSGNYPTIAYSLDGGALTTALLAGNSATTTPINLTGLAVGTHTLHIWHQADNSIGADDLWTTPVCVVRIVSLTIDNGGATVALSGTNLPVQPKECVIYGDSIAEGYNTSISGQMDAFPVFGFGLAAALDAEASIIGFGGQGYTKAGNSGSNVPTFHTVGTPVSQSWQWYFSGQSRLSAGKFTSAPNYVFICHGRNDGAATDAAVQAAVADCLTQLRAACSAGAWIFCTAPVGNFKHSAILAGYNQYQAASPDSKCKYLDLTTSYNILELQAALTSGSSSLYSFDALHPNAMAHGQIAALLANAAQTAMGGSGGGGHHHSVL